MDTQDLKCCTKDRLGMSLNLHLVNGCRLSENGFPVVDPFNGGVPARFVGFNCANSDDAEGCGVHFYIDDYQFERLWRSPRLYLPRLAKFECVISTDFSLYVDMPHPMKIWNVFRNRFFAAFWQNEGMNVIPNVSWSDPDSYGYCFEGLPRHSVIAINSMGACGHGLTKYLWRKGYEEALRRLEPTLIVRYGSRIEGEDEARSVYVANPVIERLHHGR